MTEYVLKIEASKDKFSEISRILKVEPSKSKFFWELSIDENNDLYVKAIDYFISIIENKFQELKELDINNDNISVWFYKSYTGQCNIEFSPSEMKKLSQNDITLCISCWEEE